MGVASLDRAGPSSELLGDRSLVRVGDGVGSGHSVADASCFVVTSWANWVDVDLMPYPSLRAHRERIGMRPAVQAALAAEGMVP